MTKELIVLSPEERKAVRSLQISLGSRLMKVIAKPTYAGKDAQLELNAPLKVYHMQEEHIEKMEYQRIEGELFMIFNGHKREDLIFPLYELASMKNGKIEALKKDKANVERIEMWFVDEMKAAQLCLALNNAMKERAKRIVEKLTNDLEQINTSIATNQAVIE